MVKKKRNRISLILQEMHLRKIFPASKITRHREQKLVFEHIIQPSPNSNKYKVRIEYQRNKGIRVFVIEPKLDFYKEEEFLPHVYSTSEQRLCLYYPNRIEWNVSKLFVDTILPWTSEWLFFYELWLITGEWLGGGIGHKNDAERELRNSGVDQEANLEESDN